MILKQYSILLSILTSGLFVNGQNREWSLQECIDYGVEKSLSMQQRELQNKNDKLDVRDATLSLLPSVNGISPGVSYSFGRGIDPETNTYTNTRYMSVGGFGVGSSLTVFAGFSNINRLRAAKLSRLMGWEETENQANQIAIQVMNAFFTLLYAEEEVRITQEQVENSRLRLKKIEREYELGKKPKSDLFEMQAQQASVEFRLITAQNNCLNAQANLKYIMNYNAEEELKIDARSVSEVHPELHELKRFSRKHSKHCRKSNWPLTKSVPHSSACTRQKPGYIPRSVLAEVSLSEIIVTSVRVISSRKSRTATRSGKGSASV